MWYVGLVKEEESLLIVIWPDHDMINDQDFNNVKSKSPNALELIGRSGKVSRSTRSAIVIPSM